MKTIEEDNLIDDKDIIEGLMLSDGNLIRGSVKTKLRFGQICHELVSHVRDKIFPCGKINQIKKIIDNRKPFYYFATVSSEILTDYHNKWYRQENGHFRKTVPLNLVPTPKKFLHWFMGDGSTYEYLSHSNNKKTVELVLATNRYTFEEVEFLASKFLEIGIDMNINRSNKCGWILKTNKRGNVKNFLNYIGDCPVECMRYKWKVPA